MQHRVDFLRHSAYLHRGRKRYSPAEDEDAGNRRGHGWVGGDWARQYEATSYSANQFTYRTWEYLETPAQNDPLTWSGLY